MLKWVLVSAALWIGAAWGQGYRTSGSQIVVDRQAHWRAWDFASGTVEISSQGAIQPHFVAKEINAVEDIVFQLQKNPPGNKAAADVTLRDAVEAGTNAADVVNILDGDESTYWEPSADRPLRDWWFQVDLGRLVSAKKIVLKFAAEDAGDPFLQFVVLTSDGDVTSSKDVVFNTAFRTIQGNKDQRIFEIDLEPTRRFDEDDFANDMIRLVQVVIVETDSTRAAQVPEDVYAGLAGVDVGAVDYFKKVVDGQVQVSQATYDAVDPALRGEVRRYRRERPRLADLEVWAEGENIALGLIERKGIAIDFRGNAARALVDGQFDTFLNIQSARDGTVRTLFFDLKGFYWIDTHHTYYSTERSRYGTYDLQTSDGTLAPDGTLVWTVQSSVRNRNTSNAISQYDADTFAPVRARFVQFSFWTDPNRRFELIPREVQFYGEGFQPEVELASPLIRLGAEQNLVSIEWDADVLPGTVLEIQTRSGNQLAEEYRYFNKSGVEVTQEAYDELGFFQKGDVDTLDVPGADWSPWSPPYADSGAQIASPSPRQFLLLRARLLSEDPMNSVVLNDIRVNFVDPLARQFQAELEPGTVEELGVEQTLSLFIKPVTQRQSFDEILLRAPSGMDLAFGQLRLGREAQWNDGTIEAETGVEVVSTSSDSLWLRLDEAVARGAADLIEVQFTTTLFTPGAVFQAALGNSTLENSWQRVDEADATELATSQGLLLLGPVGGRRVLSDVEIRPPVLTPNGDGVNDEMNFVFTVSKLTGAQGAKFRIYDLSGRLMRDWVEERGQVSGAYSVTWSGRDQAGDIVPPGIYLLEVDVDADSKARVERTKSHRVLQVVY